MRLPAEVARRLSGRAMEQHAEVTMARASDPMRDVGDRQVGMTKEMLRALDAAMQHEAMRRQSGRRAESVREVGRTHRERTREAGEGQVVAQMRIDVFDRPSEL